GDGGDAADRARQAQARTTGERVGIGTRLTPGAGRLRGVRAATSAAGQAADDRPSPADPNGRLHLRYLVYSDGAVSDVRLDSGDHHLSECRVDDTFAVRSGRALGIRYRHRLAPPSRRSGPRPAARSAPYLGRLR